MTQSESTTIDQTAAKIPGITTKAVLGTLDGKIQTKKSIAHRLHRSKSTIEYHIEKLSDLNLIEKVSEPEPGKATNYRLTLRGEKVLERISIPETETVRKKYYGG